MTDIEIEDLIRKAKCCAKPKFEDELPDTVVEGRFVIVDGTLYVGHDGVWESLGPNGTGTANELAFWSSENELDSATINTGLNLSGGVINSSFRDKRVALFTQFSTGTIWFGLIGGNSGSLSVTTPTFTNLYTSLYRARFSPSSTATNLVVGTKATSIYHRFSSVSGTGGFKFFAQGGTDAWDNSCRFFVGFSTADTVVTSNPSALDNTVGFAVDDTDNGQIHFLTRDTAVTKAPTGLFLSNNQGFNFSIECEPGGSSYTWSITDINTGVTSSGVATLTLPISDTLLAPRFIGSNAANASTSVIQVGISRIYVESNY